MTEDEAFIRAVVGSPGDDTPRLVYADWLDDRGDPRGPYLRAEREAVVTGDVARLRELATGLDPVWVARVSLPPVGVCCEVVDVSDPGPPVTAADVAAAERRLGFVFPAGYRGFLLNYNGGVLCRVWGDVDGETVYDDLSLTLCTLTAEPARQVGTVEEVAARHLARLDAPDCYPDRRVDPPTAAANRRLTPVGWWEADEVLLAVRGPDAGAVYVVDSLGGLLHTPGTLAAAAIGRTFPEFLARFSGLLPRWPPRPTDHVPAAHGPDDHPF